jgi:hypothetical protein
LVQQDSVESGLYQLQLQASGDASKTASSSKDSSRHAGQLAAGAAAAGTAAAAAGDEAVSQSRASSQIRVKKFNKLLGEPLVSEVMIQPLQHQTSSSRLCAEQHQVTSSSFFCASRA